MKFSRLPNLTILTALCIIVVVLLSPTFVQALSLSDWQSLMGRTASTAGVQTTASLPLLAAYIVQSILGLIGVIFFILIIYGGFRWMTAAGNEDKIAKAKKLLIHSVIGLLIVMTAYSIAFFIANAIAGPIQ